MQPRENQVRGGRLPAIFTTSFLDTARTRGGCRPSFRDSHRQCHLWQGPFSVWLQEGPQASVGLGQGCVGSWMPGLGLGMNLWGFFSLISRLHIFRAVSSFLKHWSESTEFPHTPSLWLSFPVVSILHQCGLHSSYNWPACLGISLLTKVQSSHEGLLLVVCILRFWQGLKVMCPPSQCHTE